MKKSILLAITLFILVYLVGCGVKDRTGAAADNSQLSKKDTNAALSVMEPTEAEIATMPELTYHLYFRKMVDGVVHTTNGTDEPEKPRIFSLFGYTGVTVQFDSKMDMGEITRCVSPQGDEVTTWADQVYADAANLTGEKRVVIKKGMRSLDGKVLKDDLVFDFTAKEWQVRIQRIDPVTGEKLPNANMLSQPSVTVLVTFDTPADRASVEKSVQENMFIPGHQSIDGGALPEPYPQPKITFEWKSDVECRLTVEDLKQDYWYWVNLLYAHAKNGSAIIWNANYGNMPTAKPGHNNAYSFQIGQARKLMALNLDTGAKRELINMHEAFNSVGLASPDGRYIVVSPMYYADALFISSIFNLAVFDTVTGKIQYDFDAYAHLSDEPLIGNDGKLILNGHKQSPNGNYSMELQEDGTLTINDVKGKVVSVVNEVTGTINAYWLENGTIAFGTQSSGMETTAVYGADVKGSVIKTLPGYRMVSVSGDGSMIAVEKDNIVSLYDSAWEKKGEIDIQKITGRAKDEYHFDIRSIVTPVWGNGKLCFVFPPENGNGKENKLCLWDFASGETTLQTTEFMTPLYIDEKTGELIYSLGGNLMPHSYDYSE